MLALLLIALVSSGGVVALEGERVELQAGEHSLFVDGVRRTLLAAGGGSYEARRFNQSCEGFDVLLLALEKGEMSVEDWEALCYLEGAQVKVRVRGACHAALQAFRGERQLDDLSVAAAVKRECNGSSLTISPFLWNMLLLSTKDRWVALRLLWEGRELIIMYGAVAREAPELPEVASPSPAKGVDEAEGGARREIDYFKLIALLTLLGIVAVLELALSRKGN